MRRKVIELGHDCMVMSLPRKWIRENAVVKGMELEVTAEEDRLLILPKGTEKKPQEIELDIEDIRESATRTVLVNAYRAGYDRIKLKYAGSRKVLAHIVHNYLLGFELFHETEDRYVIESVSEPNYDNFDKILRKKFIMVKEILASIESSEILEYVTKVQSYDNFLKRCITKKITNIKSKTFMWQFLSEMTHSARECYHLHKSLKKGFRFTKKEKAILVKIQLMFETMEKGYLKNDIRLIMTLHRMEQEIVETKQKIMRQVSNPISGFYFIYLARLIYLTSSPLIGAIQLGLG